MESENKLSKARDFVTKYETALDCVVVLSSPIWITSLNNLVGVENNFNPATIAEFVSLAIASSVCGAAIENRERPSALIRETAYYLSLAFRPNERQKVKAADNEFYLKQREEFENLSKRPFKLIDIV